jgi:hypothetical protein
MQRVPDFQQYTLPILSPLPIPKSQLLNPLRFQEPLLGKVQLPLPREAMTEPVQFH